MRSTSSVVLLGFLWVIWEAFGVPKPTEWTNLVAHLDDDPPTALDAIRGLQALVDEERLRHIGRARESGMSWKQIGERLGVTAQAVHRRFAWLV